VKICPAGQAFESVLDRKGLWNQQLCSDLNFVRVGQFVLVGFKDFHVLVGVPVELFADFRKVVTGPDDVGSCCRARRTRSTRCGGSRGGRSLNIGDQI